MTKSTKSAAKSTIASTSNVAAKTRYLLASSPSKKATKTSAKKAPKVEVIERTPNMDRSLKITKLVKTNPRAEGSFGWESFNLICSGMTVEAYIAAGGRSKDLRWDISKGNVKVSKK